MAKRIALLTVLTGALVVTVYLTSTPCRPGDWGVRLGSVVRVAGC